MKCHGLEHSGDNSGVILFNYLIENVYVHFCHWEESMLVINSYVISHKSMLVISHKSRFMQVDWHIQMSNSYIFTPHKPF